MPEPDLFQIFTRPLNRSGLGYMVTGAAASIVYGEPRLTHDLDVVLEFSSGDAERFASSFPQEIFYCPPLEVLRLEAQRPLRGHFNLIHHETGFKADLYLVGEDPLHHWAMPRRKAVTFGGEPLWVAPPEYVILRKLQYYREGLQEKHLRDIRAILSVSSDQIDFPELDRWMKRLRLEAEWSKASARWQGSA